MICAHEKVRCTNNVFFCVKCGQRLPDNWLAYKQDGTKETPPDGPKKAVKRRAKKGEAK